MRFQETRKEFIFEEERPFMSCHASTLVVLPDREILAAWFAGTKESAGDVAIWCSIRSKGRWTPPFKVADQEGIPHWNPVLFRRDDNKIFLYYKVGQYISKWTTMVICSEDNGRTWSQPAPLVKGDVGGRGPVKNKPIVLQDGTLLAPASIEGKQWDAFVDISYDGGVTWKKSEMVPFRHSGEGKGIIQPTLWESTPGHVHMLLRSSKSRIYRSDSTDGGKTWTPAYATSLPNNNSGIDLTKLQDETLLLAYNPVASPKGPRTPLVLSISTDNGITWGKKFVLEDGEGQYSYPAIVSEGNMVFITYTWKRERIAFWQIKVEY